MRVKNDIIRLLRAGYAYNRIAEELSCSKATVAYHAKKIGVAPGFKKYDWTEIQKYFDEGHSIRECMKKFGFSSCTWYGACADGKIVPRQDYRIPLAVLMEENRRTSRTHLKDRLIQAGILLPRCSRCGLTEWLGQSLSLELHHINGKNKDNRLENLQLLCPNCHSQTPTYSGRNAAKYTQ